MKKKHVKSWSLTALVLFFLSGCSSPTTTAEEEIPEYKEDAQISISSVIYDKERSIYNVEYTSNLDYNLKFSATLFDTEQQVIGKKENIIVEEESNGYGYRDIEIEPIKSAFEDLKEVAVYLELEIEADFKKGINKNFVYSYGLDGEVGGGYTADVIEQYKDSEYVEISTESPDDYDRYLMTIKSDPYTIKDFVLTDSTEEPKKAQSLSYSADFIDYNVKYYEQFRSHMDLIASNFEILAMDGFSNQNIVDDLTTWTSEFNGLLDVYAADSIPFNETDKALQNHTMEMISKQRLVNENIISGLTEYDETYFFTAGEHLESVTDMYLDGYTLLKN